MTVVKPNLGPHSGVANNQLTFEQAFTQAESNPTQTYHTTGNQTPFSVLASWGKHGEHAGERVLRFMTGSTERARAYECCWGHRTNCINQHIDLYSEAIDIQAQA
jgi:hypothetical protein